MLVRMQDVSTPLENPTRHARDEPRLVRTMKESH